MLGTAIALMPPARNSYRVGLMPSAAKRPRSRKNFKYSFSCSSTVAEAVTCALAPVIEVYLP